MSSTAKKLGNLGNPRFDGPPYRQQFLVALAAHLPVSPGALSGQALLLGDTGDCGHASHAGDSSVEPALVASPCVEAKPEQHEASHPSGTSNMSPERHRIQLCTHPLTVRAFHGA